MVLISLIAAQVRDMHRDRAVLERDYAARLQLLAKKAADKKSKMEASIVVGEDPTKAWNTNTLKQKWVWIYVCTIYMPVDLNLQHFTFSV